MGLATAVVILVAAFYFGGWPWIVPTLIGSTALRRTRDFSPAAIVFLGGVGLLWLALFHWTGDRRLYFPYTMQYAVQTAMLLRGSAPWPTVIGGGVVVLAFTLIRIWQEATVGVLTVELIVAALILVMTALLHGRDARPASARTATAAIASLIAFASLAL